MAKERSSSEKRPDTGVTKKVTRAASSRANSPGSVHSGISSSRTLHSVTKPSKAPGQFVAKDSRKKEQRAAHRKCFDAMDKLGEWFRLALTEKDNERAYQSQLLHKLQVEKAEESSKLQQAIVMRENALVDNQRLQSEIQQLQQQVESMNATIQDNIPWNDIELLWHQTHGGLVSATTQFWKAIEALQNRRIASYLPGSGVIHGNMTEQYGPLGTLGHDALPGFSVSGNPPLSSQQEHMATNAFDSLV
ncbi:uncharacterized protein N7484_005319 [Penicillium longicatenatum]|uniref:uncharacterized protein n=1 Tax=Penicillium longicatenatum TaxID=1561947 RepID=UPI00254691A4|nr:uncharacterized protein N7484_005319 [Penicillium longicatenatum]KAJ5651596.1 hypothetical protein N7484_005319 [Penicillium longicatenatum]